MRIVKELKLDDINISIFKMEQKFTLKLEWKRVEQVFKLDGRDGVESLDHVLGLIDQSFIQNAKNVFEKMINHRNERLKVLIEMEGEEFPEII